MKKKRILMVDDEPGFTRMAKISLEARGQYLVEVVNQSPEALDAARRFKPDVILLDLIMPVLDGGDVAAQLREDPELRNVPLIFFTATASGKAAADGELVTGGHVFLSKPAALQDLVRCIEAAYAKNPSGPASDPPATGAELQP